MVDETREAGFDANSEKINLNYLLTNKLDKVDTLPQSQRISTLQSLIITTTGITGVGLPDMPSMEEVKAEWNAVNGTTVKIMLRESRAVRHGEFAVVRNDLLERKLWQTALKTINNLYVGGFIGFETLQAMEKFCPAGV